MQDTIIARDTIMSFDAKDFNRESANERLYLKAINYEKNIDMLKNAVYIKVDDLALVARFKCHEDEKGAYSFKVEKKHLPLLKMTESEVLEIATQNTKDKAYTVRPITDVIKDMLNLEDAEMEGVTVGDIPLYVVTTENMQNGAVGIFVFEDLRQEVYESIGCDDGYYILPCSTEEIIAVPNIFDSNELKELVNQVNSTVLSPNDFLSNNVYFCDTDLRISVCDSDIAVLDFEADCIAEKRGLCL